MSKFCIYMKHCLLLYSGTTQRWNVCSWHMSIYLFPDNTKHNFWKGKLYDRSDFRNILRNLYFSICIRTCLYIYVCTFGIENTALWIQKGWTLFIGKIYCDEIWVSSIKTDNICNNVKGNRFKYPIMCLEICILFLLLIVWN